MEVWIKELGPVAMQRIVRARATQSRTFSVVKTVRLEFCDGF